MSIEEPIGPARPDDNARLIDHAPALLAWLEKAVQMANQATLGPDHAPSMTAWAWLAEHAGAVVASALEELERMLVDAGIGGPDELQRAKEESRGLGLFVRSLVGLDREAAKRAFARFLAVDGKPPSANQIEFINLIIEHLSPCWARSGRGRRRDFSPCRVDGTLRHE